MSWVESPRLILARVDEIQADLVTSLCTSYQDTEMNKVFEVPPELRVASSRLADAVHKLRNLSDWSLKLFCDSLPVDIVQRTDGTGRLDQDVAVMKHDQFMPLLDVQMVPHDPYADPVMFFGDDTQGIYISEFSLAVASSLGNKIKLVDSNDQLVR